eukprot:Opistho-2@53656
MLQLCYRNVIYHKNSLSYLYNYYLRYYTKITMAKNKNSQVKLVLTQLITDIFTKNKNVALNHKQVAAKLNLKDGASAETILEILIEQTEKGIFIRPERGKFKMKELKTFVTGTVDMTAEGSAFIVPDDEFEKDIFVAPRKLRNALHGDKV